ncbi:LPS assembly lipoprotein LptE [Rhizobiaceae bacterium BDR2-2]|uniref:LPS assembly lipoprotein LptE n=1 Tax=Ectorhizobium quercum TaxID=2965071 RepID=A0AAE3SXV3_9HYPH|nr:LPS assembly lipoprotein LptE [Ectorhizobium quercum]MCX8999504.1 LPS assembly lipoprotein LptE [Ectorhizobium quercum]
MSSDRRSRTGTFFAALVLTISAGLLSACQVRPLYSEHSATSQALKSIGFSQAEDRVAQEVRNRLIFLTSGGAGEAVNPEYQVDLAVRTRIVGVLVDATSDEARAGRVIVNVTYALKRARTGEIIKNGNRSAIALVDYPEQEFAKIRAIRDAENRAAREAAEFVRMDLAGALVQ